MITTNLGRVIRRLREFAGWTQEEFGSELGRCGHKARSGVCVGYRERGKRSMRLEDLEAVASLLGTTPAGLLAAAEGDA